MMKIEDIILIVLVSLIFLMFIVLYVIMYFVYGKAKEYQEKITKYEVIFSNLTANIDKLMTQINFINGSSSSLSTEITKLKK